MKHLLTILAIFAACIAGAQTPIQSYEQQPVELGPAQLGRDTIDGVVLNRYAQFVTMILNSRTKEVSLSIKCYVRTRTTDKPIGVRPVWVELKASQSTYNLVSDGSPIGDINTVLNTYGIRDTTIVDGQPVYGWKMQNGKYLTSQPIQDGWSTYTAMMDGQDVRLRNVIRSTMLRPYNLSIIRAALIQAVQQGNAE